MPAELFAYVEAERGGGSRGAFFRRLLRDRRAEEYRRGYTEQPETGERYSSDLLAAALAENPSE